MTLRKLTTLSLSVLLLAFSCNNDDDNTPSVVERDRAEVYAEDIVRIEDFLKTHFYNKEEFELNDTYSDLNTGVITPNDEFKIEFFEVADPENEMTLWDLLDNDPNNMSHVLKFKEVSDGLGYNYKLYYLIVREGLGNTIHSLDRATVTYEGQTLNKEVFDTSILPVNFNLTQFSTSGGVVKGFREGLIELKTSEDFTENTSDGTVIYHNHGIGAVFIPSGLGYFSAYLSPILNGYNPLVFTYNTIARNGTDYDLDNIPSYMEDLNNDQDGYNDDSDSDGQANFFDNDDDGDGVLTRNELDYETYLVNLTNMESEPVLANNEFESSRTTYIDDTSGDEILEIKTVIQTDTDGDGIYDYLDSDS